MLPIRIRNPDWFKSCALRGIVSVSPRSFQRKTINSPFASIDEKTDLFDQKYWPNELYVSHTSVKKDETFRNLHEVW